MKKLIVLTSASILALGTALAATPVDNGVYLEGNVGYGQVLKPVGELTKKRNTGFVWNVDAGYKVNKNLGIEAGYTQYNKQKYTVKGLSPDYYIRGTDSYTIDLALKGILPLQEGFSLFAKVGPGYAHQKWSDNLGDSDAYHKVVAYGAIGAGYAVTPNLELTVQGAGSTKNSDNVPARWSVTGGATYTI
ncbi:MAG: outer membrane beta-barrel protein [Gammaproteobacteria bacterium]|nr:outer membrane beta-barrel protein [Gammaproteobacteria bacterium]